jgi:putative acetyltransferase
MQFEVAFETVDQPEAVALVGELDAHLEPLYPPESRHGLNLEALRAPHVRFALARDGEGRAQACGAVALMEGYAELKRMYVRPQFRGRGAAEAIVQLLERAAASHGYVVMRLETGVKQLAALRFYERLGFVRRRPFGKYRDDPLSICMEKGIAPPAAGR